MHRYQYQSGAYYDPWNDMVACHPPIADTDLEIFITPHFERQSHLMNTAAVNATMMQQNAGAVQNVRVGTASNIIQGMVIGHAPFGDTFLKTFGGDDIGDCRQIEYAGSGRLAIRCMTGLLPAPWTHGNIKVYTQQIRKY